MMRRRIQWLLVALGLMQATVNSVSARPIDLSGVWEKTNMEDAAAVGFGPDPVDFTGLPINDDARARALSYSSEMLSVPEHQCAAYNPVYLVMGPFPVRISAISDPITGNITSWRVSPWIDRPALIVWMDGRERPSEHALHTTAGFATGHWEGETLTVEVSHFNEGPLRRNGVPTSSRATLTLHFTRHGDYLQITGILKDPAYLTEPFITSSLFQLNSNYFRQNDFVQPCTPTEEVPMKRGTVPNYLPGANSQIDYMPQHHGIPRTAALGGAATMYPEYVQPLRKQYVMPKTECGTNCCIWGPREPVTLAKIESLKCAMAPKP